MVRNNNISITPSFDSYNLPKPLPFCRYPILPAFSFCIISSIRPYVTRKSSKIIRVCLYRGRVKQIELYSFARYAGTINWRISWCWWPWSIFFRSIRNATNQWIKGWHYEMKNPDAWMIRFLDCYYDTLHLLSVLGPSLTRRCHHLDLLFSISSECSRLEASSLEEKDLIIVYDLKRKC